MCCDSVMCIKGVKTVAEASVPWAGRYVPCLVLSYFVLCFAYRRSGDHHTVLVSSAINLKIGVLDPSMINVVRDGMIVRLLDL